MRRLLLIILLLVSGPLLSGQGFIRNISLPSPYSLRYFSTNHIHFGQTESDLVLWYYGGGNSHNDYFLSYDTKSKDLKQFETISSVPTRARFIGYGPHQYAVRDGSSGALSGRPYWHFLDFEGLKNAKFYPEYRGATSLAQRNDSLFLLYSKLPIEWWNDTNTLYYLSYLNPIEAREEIIDSIRIPFYLSNAGLYYHSDQTYWEVFHEDYRIHFRKGDLLPDTIYQDPRFDIQNFEHFYFDANINRQTYFRQGLSKVLWNRDLGEAYQVNYGPFDTTYYDLSLISDFIQEEIFRIRNVGNLYDFNGTRADLSTFTEIQQALDVSFISKDSIFAFRLEDGQIRSQLLLSREELYPYIVDMVKSTSTGGFYLSGSRYSQWPEGNFLSMFLIYRDAQGNMSPLLGETSFDLHVNRTSHSLSIFAGDPWEKLSYRILDISGRITEEGTFTVYDGVDLEDWQSGFYYLQLWSENQVYRGQKPFIIQ